MKNSEKIFKLEYWESLSKSLELSLVEGIFWLLKFVKKILKDNPNKIINNAVNLKFHLILIFLIY